MVWFTIATTYGNYNQGFDSIPPHQQQPTTQPHHTTTLPFHHPITRPPHHTTAKSTTPTRGSGFWQKGNNGQFISIQNFMSRFFFRCFTSTLHPYIDLSVQFCKDGFSEKNKSFRNFHHRGVSDIHLNERVHPKKVIPSKNIQTLRDKNQ